VVLKIREDIAEVAAIVRDFPAGEIEQRLVDGGCIVAASCTPEEWRLTPSAP
jgi:hypothetical protein